MDNTRRFDGYADDYAAGRPDYAEELIDLLYDRYGLTSASVIADIGSGTGKFSEQLLKRGSTVWSVEPGEDMRRAAEKVLCTYERSRSVKGDAEHTTLSDGSVDAVTAAQAFHWFDTEKFRRECERILRTGGPVILVWDLRDPSDPLTTELHKIYTRYCPRFAGFSGGITEDDPRIRSFFGGKYDHVSFPHPLQYDRPKFISRCLSGSYSLRSGDTGYTDYIAALDDMFDRYARDGIVALGNSSDAYIGRI